MIKSLLRPIDVTLQIPDVKKFIRDTKWKPNISLDLALEKLINYRRNINAKKSRILITGGAGYIGSKLSTRLVELGYDVTVIDILKFNKNSLLHLLSKKNFKLIYGDTRNKNLLNKELKNKDIIIPLAALVGAPLCEKFPKLAKEINFNIIKYILSKINPNQKVIYPNTNSGYGVGKKNAYCTEESDLNPISLYGRTKVDAEKLILKHKKILLYLD